LSDQPDKKLIDRKALEAMKKAAVFERQPDRKFNDEWGHGGVRISCGPRFWVVHIPCDPTYGGSIDIQTNKCVVCNKEVPEEIRQAFEIKFPKPGPWKINEKVILN